MLQLQAIKHNPAGSLFEYVPPSNQPRSHRKKATGSKRGVKLASSGGENRDDGDTGSMKSHDTRPTTAGGEPKRSVTAGAVRKAL